MCGIAGFIGKGPVDRGRIEAALHTMQHRGPDGSGYHENRKGQYCVLLHRRLAILDLDPRANQPFEWQGHWLVFNGEIYNYIELRHELVKLGHDFKTEGDTEVLMHALVQWGESALDRMEGMWAFAWRRPDGIVILSRDRFGEKPLFVWRRDEGLYFASEVKSLAALAGCWPGKNLNHIYRYLVNGYKALYKTKETFFQNVHEVPAGFNCSIDETGNKEYPYWSPDPQVDDSLSYEGAVELIRSRMVDAVRIRMRSDVPLAFCMSGGVDSNSLISIARNELGCDVHGFTIVNTDARYEEQSLVDLAVASQGLKHTSVPLDKNNFISNLNYLVRQHDSPVSTLSYYLHWNLMRGMQAEGYKVSISGTAADELFTGYYDHHNLYMWEIRNDAQLLEESLANWRRYQGSIVRNPYLKDPELYIKDASVRDHIFLNNHIFSEWLVHPWKEEFSELDLGKGLLRKRMLNELFAEAVPVILHEDDLNAMSVSIENRSPFLDRRLFDAAYSIPAKHLIKNGRAKSVLREAMRGIVPDAILDATRKVGFNAPILDLLDTSDPLVRESVLDNSPIFEHVKKECLEEALSKPEMPNSMSKFIFNFLNAKIFLEEF